MFKQRLIYVSVLITLLLIMGCTAEPLEVTVEVEKEITVEVEVEKEVTVEVEKEVTVEVEKEITVEVEKEVTVEVEVTAVPPDPIQPVIEESGESAGDEVAPQTDLAADIDAMMAMQVQLNKLGGVILVKEGDQVTLQKGYGLANLADEIPFTADTPYPIGISTAFFTAVRVMMLSEEGKLDLQDPICDYLNDCPSEWQPITIHHLLSLQSGLPDYVIAGKFTRSMDESRTKEDLFDAIRDVPLKETPGTWGIWNLRNPSSNHLVAGLIIEQVTGSSLADEIEQAIFTPLGMDRSGVLDGEYPADFPRLYNFKREQTLDFSNFYAMGDIYSTVGDMILMQDAMESEQLLSQAGWDEMRVFHNDLARFGYTGGFGYGHMWMDVREDGQTQTGVRRTNQATYYVTWTLQSSYEPTDVDVVLFINQQNVNLTFVASSIDNLVFEQGSQ